MGRPIPPAPDRFGSSDVTWGRTMRVLLTVPALLPLWFVVRLVVSLVAFAGSAAGGAPAYPGSPLLDVPLAALGGWLSALVLTYLRDVWRTNPAWGTADHAAFVLQQRLQDEVDKAASPVDPSTSIDQRRAPPRW